MAHGTGLSVIVAHSGKSLTLTSANFTRVADVHHALESLTGLRPAEQILMLRGHPLDKNQLLAHYHINSTGSGDDGAEMPPIFVFSRTHLRPGGTTPALEELPEISIEEPTSGSIQYEEHPLDSAPSPLLRALPAFERQFRAHLRRANAFAKAAQVRLAQSDRLLSEMDAQGQAIDAARSNVEHHYNWIQDASTEFLRKYRIQTAAHTGILQQFWGDMEALGAADLHPAARAGRATSLLHLLPEAKLREWHASCVRAHQQFAEKVAALEGVFKDLRADVEALLLAVPTSDPEQLALQFRDRKLQAEEQVSIAAAISQDFVRVQSLVEEAVHSLSARPSAASLGPLDAAGVMESMLEAHTTKLLPRLEAGDAVLLQFAEHCLECKKEMTQEVVEQLRAISAQQSKIGRTKGQLAVFRQVAGRQSEAIAELLLPRRLPSAYRHCLSECMRRKAFAQVYAGEAGRVAETMARLRAEELTARDDFRSAVERYIPGNVLGALGLLARPPHCEVNVPPPETGLADVVLADLEEVPAGQQLELAAPFNNDTPRSPALSRGSSVGGGGGAIGSSDAVAAPLAAAEAPDALSAAVEAQEDVMALMEVENARLRAHVAKLVAMACLTQQAAVTACIALPATSSPSHPSRFTDRREGASSAASAHTSRQSSHHSADAAESAALFREALSAREEVAGRLDRQLMASRQQAAAYELRIRVLEAALTQESGLQRSRSVASHGTSSHSAATCASIVGSAQLSPRGLTPQIEDGHGALLPNSHVIADRQQRPVHLPPLSPTVCAVATPPVSTVAPTPSSEQDDIGASRIGVSASLTRPSPVLSGTGPSAAMSAQPEVAAGGATGFEASPRLNISATSSSKALFDVGAAVIDTNTPIPAKSNLQGGRTTAVLNVAASPSDFLVNSDSDGLAGVPPASAQHTSSSVAPCPSLTSLAETTNTFTASQDEREASGQFVAGLDAALPAHLVGNHSDSADGKDLTDVVSPIATSGFCVTGFQPQSVSASVADRGDRASTPVIPVLEPAAGSRKRANYDAIIRTVSASESPVASPGSSLAPQSLETPESSTPTAEGGSSSSGL